MIPFQILFDHSTWQNLHFIKANQVYIWSYCLWTIISNVHDDFGTVDNLTNKDIANRILCGTIPCSNYLESNKHDDTKVEINVLLVHVRKSSWNFASIPQSEGTIQHWLNKHVHGWSNSQKTSIQDVHTHCISHICIVASYIRSYILIINNYFVYRSLLTINYYGSHVIGEVNPTLLGFTKWSCGSSKNIIRSLCRCQLYM